ncbi:uncharacterized protein LOC128989650 isoform X1 [Macrosteles quadrilineatus]|uniref:uncharacterized protein LOC128989650 isoform X1 n=2 Tax=Macrosteles quadrilineatus TaxID=74068 RepID=UPI0023E2551D|nr:uncharacterized protein LOC128989650 isoform X1 [Macrosteles quadrilineatus]
MEGYTNVIGSSYDFDDLDIEGRVVDEWNADEEEKHSSKKELPKNADERTLLSERVKLDNGQQADVFSVVRKKEGVWYTCHVCSETVAGLSALRQHSDSGRHRANMSRPTHPCAKFIKLDPKENLSLEPGEPVPPGLEEVIIKNALIQPKLDAYKAPLIGLEFMVELTESTLDETEYYYCLLCEKTGSERNMFIHFTSIFHYMKYLSMYFPTVARKLQALPQKKDMRKAFGLLVTDIIKDIEEKFGRMKPKTVKYQEFYFQDRKNELHKTSYEGPHFRELDGELFDEKATAENLNKKNKEVIAAPPVTMQSITVPKSNENTESSGITFNKNNRINVDKKQIRSRDEDGRNSSPDVEIVNVTHKTKPPGHKRTRSRSLSSISSLSSASSHGKSRYRYRSSSRHHVKGTSNRHWSRSRSRSPSYRYRRHARRSPSYGHRSRSPHAYSRSHYHNSSRPRHTSRGHSPPPPYRLRVDRYGREIREIYDSRSDRYRREYTPEGRISPKEMISSEEKAIWEKFREELKKVETAKLEKLKYYEKNPEKHPQYPEEWKAFWNKRYNELQRSGIDPSKHDFKPEWIAVWAKRTKEIHEEDLAKAKEELKKKFNLPEDPGDNAMPWKYHQRKRKNTSPGLVDISPPTPEKKDMIADIKTTWKAFTGSDIKDTPKRPLSPWEDDVPSSRRKNSPKSTSSTPPPNADEKLLEDMPQRKTRTSALIFVLRKFTVLEQQLGSLAPKTFELMSQSLALEKIKEDASLDLLLEEENSVYLETVREKLIALLCAGVVPRNCVNTARSAIKNTDVALYLASKKQRSLPVATVRAVMHGSFPPPPSSLGIQPYASVGLQPVTRSEPMVVPGVGAVDKIAIAQQIAAALVEQGKTNVTESELNQLINAVVGMAEASAHSSRPMTTAYFLQQLQAAQNSSVPTPATSIPPVAPSIGNLEPLKPVSSEAQLQINAPQPASNILQPKSSAAFGALKLLQSAYNESTKADQDSPKRDVEQVPTNSFISDQELASTLSVFNKMTKEDQPSFVQRLKTNNIEMYKRLCPFIPTSVIVAADNPSPSSTSSNVKRSPINIPISKNKSEQKIKSTSSGRLSPFSQRSGGANPTIGDKVVIDDDDDEDGKNDVKIVHESRNTQVPFLGNFDSSKYKSKESDLEDDDDDDDDYSFEDVYKAAQEKLRQQQKLIDEENKKNQSNESKETTKPEAKQADELNSDKSRQSTPQSNTWSNLGNPEKPPFITAENPSQLKQTTNDQLNTQKGNPDNIFMGKQSLYSDAIPARHDAYQGSNQQPYTYQGPTQERQSQLDPYTNSGQPQPAYGTSFIPTYSNKEQYSGNPQVNTDYYNKNSNFASNKEQPGTYGNPYGSNRDSFNAPPSNASSNPTYGNQNIANPRYGNQSTPGNSNYGNPISTYSNNQYGYRDPQTGANNFSQGYPQTPNPPNYSNQPAVPPRYPNQRYPPY